MAPYGPAIHQGGGALYLGNLAFMLGCFSLSFNHVVFTEKTIRSYSTHVWH